LPVPAASAPAAAKAVLKSAAASFGSGAATAPARDTNPAPPDAAVATPEPDLFESPAAEAPAAANPSAAPTSFTFGGNAVAEAGGSKKNLLIIAAVVVVAALSYAGWGYFAAHRSVPMSNPAPETQPNTSRPAPAMSTPAPAPKAQTPPAITTPVPIATPTVAEHKQHASDADDSEDSDSVKPSAAASASAKKTADKPAPAPLVVKGGTVKGIAKPAAPDTAAPSVIGIATAGTSGPLPNLVGSDSAKPVLQRMNVSQGVSQGLLIKKVAPTYPPTALHMRIEGAVQLQATVSKTGDITEVKVLSGDKQLTRAATDAVKQWKYKPYLLNGDPVDIQTQITINFKLPQ